jgi:hypothetical protein
VLLASTNGLMAFEAGQLSLDTPNVLKKSEGSFNIRHRFFGVADDSEKFFGSDDGGNMHIGLKYAVMDNLVLGVDHTRDESAYGIGLEYAHDFKWASLGVRANGFRLNKGTKKDKSYQFIGSMQTPNYFDHVRFTGNIGHDAYFEHTIAGLGVDINMANPISWLAFTENLSVLGEYYPQVDKVAGVSGEYDAYAFGIKSQTYGHHFELLLSNSTNMDPRTMSLGTNSDKLHLGFNINRKF